MSKKSSWLSVISTLLVLVLLIDIVLMKDAYINDHLVLWICFTGFPLLLVLLYVVYKQYKDREEEKL